MSVLKQYNTGTSTWDTIVVGQQGQPGVQTGSVAPTNTNILWMDTADAGSQIAVPSGGNAGQVLAKTSATDYATGWTEATGQGNAVINGAMDIWQRGTTGSVTTGNVSYLSADRYKVFAAGTAPTVTFAQSTDIPTSVPVKYSAALSWGSTTTAGSDIIVAQYIENGKSLFAGQTVTFSFYAKAAVPVTANSVFDQDYGGSSFNITTSWQRFTWTLTVPSNYAANTPSGASNSTHTEMRFLRFTGAGFVANTVYVTGVQLEVSPAPTPFKRAGGTMQGELAACQRYYYRWNGNSTVTAGFGIGMSSTVVRMTYSPPVPMRISPTSIDYLNLQTFDGVNAFNNPTAAISYSQPESVNVALTYGSAVITQFRPYFPSFAGVGYIGFSAEL